MTFSEWLATWLVRHPVKSPPHDPAAYTTQVMARVRASSQPALAPAMKPWWRSWPQLSLAVATATAGLLLLWAVPSTMPGSLIAAITHDASLLSTLDELQPALWANHDELDGLAEELNTLDTVMLAQSPDDDAQWVEQTLQVLDALDESAPERSLENTPDTSINDPSLDELEWFDRQLSASS